jgi:hypothetical protein
MTQTHTQYDDSGDALGLLAGSGILLVQAAAVIPGLLPVLLLLLPLALPLVALGIVLAPFVAIAIGVRRLVAVAITRTSAGRRRDSAHLGQFASEH